MDLTMRVQLYYGDCPVKGDDEGMQIALDGESGYRGYWAVFVRNDIPSQIHDAFTSRMVVSYGLDSNFHRTMNDYLKPVLVNSEGNATRELKDSHVGGLCFSEKMADIVVKALEKRGYSIEKMYERPRSDGRFDFVPLAIGFVGHKEPGRIDPL